MKESFVALRKYYGQCAFMFSRQLTLFALLLLYAQTAYAGLMHDSELTWVTAESAHFRIHYHDDEKQLADRSLQIAESVYERLTPELDWQPKEKTETKKHCSKQTL